MKFVADDGMIFDTMEECEEYEKTDDEGKEIARLWHDYVTTYNGRGQITKPNGDLENTKKFVYEICNIIDSYQSSFINIDHNCDERKWVNVFNYFYNKHDFILPVRPGCWRYDDENDEWIEFNEEFEAFKKKWAPVGIHLMRL